MSVTISDGIDNENQGQDVKASAASTSTSSIPATSVPSAWIASYPPNRTSLSSVSLSHLILKHIKKLTKENGGDCESESDALAAFPASPYYDRVVAALFLANVHYLLYARGLIHTHLGHLLRENAAAKATANESTATPLLKARGKKRAAFIDSLATLEGRVQHLVQSVRDEEGGDESDTVTLPLAVVLGPSPISPRRIHYIEQTVRRREGEAAASSTPASQQQPAHSLLPTFTRSSLSLSLTRFLMTLGENESDSSKPMKRSTKLFVFTLQRADWKAPAGWHRRHGVRLDLSSLRGEENGDDDEEESGDHDKARRPATRNGTPASLLDDEDESSRTPSPAPAPPPRTPHTPRPVSLLRRNSQPSQQPNQPVDVSSPRQHDSRPVGSRLTNLLASTSTSTSGSHRRMVLKPRNANGSENSRLTSGLRTRCASSRRAPPVVGYRIESSGDNDERGGGRCPTPPPPSPLAWFQCETVISGFT